MWFSQHKGLTALRAPPALPTLPAATATVNTLGRRRSGDADGSSTPQPLSPVGRPPIPQPQLVHTLTLRLVPH